MYVQPLNSSVVSRVKTVKASVIHLLIGQDSTMWDVVTVSPQAHNSDDDRHQFFRQAARCTTTLACSELVQCAPLCA